jgi:hypothetical protein
MTGLVVFGVLATAFLLYAADLLVKAWVRARRLRRMSERLAAAAVRAEEQQAQRVAAAEASAALTSVVPAIRHPLTVPGRVRDDEETPE